MWAKLPALTVLKTKTPANKILDRGKARTLRYGDEERLGEEEVLRVIVSPCPLSFNFIIYHAKLACVFP